TRKRRFRSEQDGSGSPIDYAALGITNFGKEIQTFFLTYDSCCHTPQITLHFPVFLSFEVANPMEYASRPALRRLLTEDRLIRAGGYPNARVLAAKLEVHPRTVHRDLEFLRDSWGAPLEYDARRHGFYYRVSDFALPLLRLSEVELLALFLAEPSMQ